MRNLLSILVVLSMLNSATSRAQCKSDSECKGDRICEKGKCVSPKQGCTKDADCAGQLVCQEAQCVAQSKEEKVIAPKPQRADDDVPLKTIDANMQRGWEAVGGKLIITKTKIVFTSHSMNVQTGDTVIAISEIKKLKRANRLGFVPTGLDIVMEDGTKYEFTVPDRNKLIKQINELRGE